jgi:hypothetical protein
MGTQRVHLTEKFLGLVRWARQGGTRDFCPALAAIVSPVQNFFFLTGHFFSGLVPIAGTDRQSVRVTCLLTLSYSSKINGGFSALKKRRDMFSEGNAAHPVRCDSPLQIVMAGRRAF